MAAKRSFSVSLAFASAILFGVSTPISKLLLQDTNPFQLSGMMYLGAGLGLLPLVFFGRWGQSGIRPGKKDRQRILGMVICGGLFGPVLLLFGLKFASASSVSLWLNFELLFTALLGYLFFHDHMGSFTWAGVLVGVLAGILLSVQGGYSGAWGGLFVLLACLFWGLDNHFTALIDGITAVQSTVIKGISAGSINFIIGYALSGWNPHLFLIAIGVGFISYGLSIVFYILSAQNLGATRSQVIFSSAPFFGLFFSILLLHEKITLLQAASASCMILAVSMIFFEKHGHKHTHQVLEHTHSHRHDDLHHTHNHTGQPNRKTHSHSHEHQEFVHSHPHWPDIHHRHEHNPRED